LLSPRAKAITTQIREIRETFPQDKIIIASRFILFLDLLRETLRHLARQDQLFNFEVAEYNGTVNSLETRTATLKAFNAEGSGPIVLLLSSAAEGTGLNITGASHLLICEPMWSPGQIEQIIGRIYGMGQDKHVVVYLFWAPLSLVDVKILDGTIRTAGVQQDLMKAIHRKDTEPFHLPRLPDRDELPLQGYSH
jgi:hypothetical protein